MSTDKYTSTGNLVKASCVLLGPGQIRCISVQHANTADENDFVLGGPVDIYVGDEHSECRGDDATYSTRSGVVAWTDRNGTVLQAYLLKTANAKPVIFKQDWGGGSWAGTGDIWVPDPSWNLRHLLPAPSATPTTHQSMHADVTCSLVQSANNGDPTKPDLQGPVSITSGHTNVATHRGAARYSTASGNLA